VWGGKAKKDVCQVCGGNGKSCLDCAGTPNGKAKKDKCGKCDADPTNDCKQDICGVWGGNGKCAAKSKSTTHVTPTIVAMSVLCNGKSYPKGYTTYRLYANLRAGAKNAFAMVGSGQSTMYFPPAFQVMKPNNGGHFATIGGPAKFMFSMFPLAQYDSWVTLGLEESNGKLQSKGFDDAIKNPGWNIIGKRPIKISNGAVFFMDPKNPIGATKAAPILIAQLTLPTGFSGNVRAGFQGKTDANKDWRDEGVQWGIDSSIKGRCPPPPPPPAPCGVKDAPKPSYPNGKNVDTSVVQLSTMTFKKKTYATFRLYGTLKGKATYVYSVAGTKDGKIILPPAFQSQKSSSVGGIDPLFFGLIATAKYDSWLTVGVDGPSGGLMGSKSATPLTTWTSTTGYSSDNIGVFWMSPTDASKKTAQKANINTLAGKPILFAQITVELPCGNPKSKAWTVQMNVIGKTAAGVEWRDNKLRWGFRYSPPYAMPGTVKEVCQNVDGAKCGIFAQDGATKLAVGSNDKAASKECSSISSALAQSALGMSSGAKKCKAGSTISRVAMQKGSYATGVVTVKGVNMKGGRASMLAGETMYELSVKLSGGASTVYAVKDMKLPPSAFQAITYNRPGVPSTGLARSQDCHFSGVDPFLLGPRGKAFLSEDPLSHSWVSIGTDTTSFAGKTWNVGNMQEASRRTFLIQNNFMGAVNTWGTKKGNFAGAIVFIANSNPQSYQSTNKIKLSSGVVVAQVTSKAAKGFKGSMGVLGLGTCSVKQCKKSTPATWEQSAVAFNFP
jgi:hypothetical protein